MSTTENHNEANVVSTIVSRPCVFLQPPLRALHFSKEPVKRVRSVREQKVDSKPKGFWFSVEGNGDGWKHWCEAESFATDRFVFENEIYFADEARIAMLSSVLDIDIFHERYKAALAGMEKFGEHYIDWGRVAREYQGIVITPYIWERRLDGEAHRWYYGWDCASGCVWDAKTIREVKAAAINSTHGG